MKKGAVPNQSASGSNVAQMKGIQNYFGVYSSVEMEEFATLNRDKPSEKELKSDEQLKRHSVDANLEEKPVERALHLLTIGEEVQRLSVVQNLPQLLEGNEQLCMQRVVPRVQLALPNASTEFHMAASSTFKTILEKKLVHPRTFTQTFLQSILSSIDSRDPVVANAWLETLLDVIDLLPADVVKSDILPVAVNKGQISQKLNTRITACKLLGKISTRVDQQTLKKDTLPIVLSLCQDVKAEVRACICSQLPFVAQGLGAEGLKPSILPLLVELASDEESIVRLSSVEAIVCMLPHLQQDTLKNIIVPLVKKTCESSMRNEDNVMVVLAQVFGELCLGLEASLTLAEKRWLLNYYQQLAELGLRASDRDFATGLKNMPDLVPVANNADKFVECRHHCAFHFPAMTRFCTCTSDNFDEQLYPVFCGLACDPYFEVRRTIACGLHEVTRVLGNNNGIVKSELVKLLRDDSEEVLSGLIPNLSKTLILLTKSGMLNPDFMDTAALEIGRALLKCESEVSVTHNWRLHELLIQQLECLHMVLPSEFIHSYFTPVLFSRIHHGRQVPVRLASTNTLLVFLRYNIKNLQRNDIRSRIISELCNGHSCYSRLSFMRLCSQALELFSKKYFKEHFYLSVLERAEDPVPNIRLIFVKLLPKLKICLRMPSDKKYFAALEASIRKIISTEKDKDVLAALDRALTVLDKIECTLDTAHITTHSNKDELDDHRKLEEENRLQAACAKHGEGKQGLSPVLVPSAPMTAAAAGGRQTGSNLGKSQQTRYGQPSTSVSIPGIMNQKVVSSPTASPVPSRSNSLQRGDPSSRTGSAASGASRVGAGSSPRTFSDANQAARNNPKGPLTPAGTARDKDSLQSLPRHTGTNNTNRKATCAAYCPQCPRADCNRSYLAEANELHTLKHSFLSPGMMAGDYLQYLAQENPVLFPSILNRCFFETNRLTDDANKRAVDDKYCVRDDNTNLNCGGGGGDGMYGYPDKDGYSLHGYNVGYGAKRFMVSSLEDEFYRDAGIKIPQQFTSSALPLRMPNTRATLFKNRHASGYRDDEKDGRVKQTTGEMAPKKERNNTESKTGRSTPNAETSATFSKVAHGNTNSQKGFGSKLAMPKKIVSSVNTQRQEAEKPSGTTIVNRRHSYLAEEKTTKTNPRVEEKDVPQKRASWVADNGRRHSYMDQTKRQSFHAREEPAIPLRKNPAPRTDTADRRRSVNLTHSVKPHRVSSDNSERPQRVSSDNSERPQRVSSDNAVKPRRVSSDNASKPQRISSDNSVKRRSLMGPSVGPRPNPSRRHSSLERGGEGKLRRPGYAVETSKVPRSNNSSPGNSRSSSPVGRGRHLTAPNSRAGSPTGTLRGYIAAVRLTEPSSRLPVRKK